MNTLSHYIGGKAYANQQEQTLAVFNPATGEQTAQVPCATEATCQQAISVAQAAFPAWSATIPLKRANILYQFKQLLEKHQQDLAALVSKEHGKTLEDAKGSVLRGIEVVDLYCGLVNQLQSSYSADVSSHMNCYTTRQPLGVCLGITPFNFPVMVPLWMMIPAIACGNTFVLKPSEQTPSAPFYLMELLTKAGLPAGVVNCVYGDKSTVETLLSHPAVQAVTAVASTPVAESIYQQATALGKRAQTFGGAKNHAVIMPDADLRQTAQALVGAAFGSAGERCMAISVVVAVGEETANGLLAHLLPLVEAIRVGPGMDIHSDMGPLISQKHQEKVRQLIQSGVDEGANLLVDGRHFKHPVHHQGFYLGPSLFDQVKPSMRIYQEEIFGPVLVMLRVPDLKAALALINDNPYGNGTAIFTNNGFWAQTFSEQVQVGMVGINVPIPVPVATHPFGGWKRSMFGDTNLHGTESIQFFTRRKTVTTRWFTQSTDNPFTMPVNKE